MKRILPKIEGWEKQSKNYKENSDLVLNACIDVRLFGGVIPLDKKGRVKKRK
jgi:CRISPR/Cas system type I-B associated protein Csh2 (Cas7 group RAMP superfamily)